MTLDRRNCKRFHHRDFCEMVKEFGNPDQSSFKFRYKKRIRILKDSTIISRDEKKKYIPVMQKGIVQVNGDWDYNVIPFGAK